MSVEGLFGAVEEFPNDRARDRFAALIGLDTITRQLVADIRVLFSPHVVEAWSKKHYKAMIPAAHDVLERTPLVVLAGDVGTGKTELAETLGDPIARELKIDVTLYPLSLSARGQGSVGEMTMRLSNAFQEVAEAAKGGRGKDGKLRHGTILLIDEADAVAQSRELAQMHHEDRAGVNALIRGIDDLRRARLPVLTIMCTNRLSALDPGVRRRAVAVIRFTRPDAADREATLRRAFQGTSVTGTDIIEAARLTGEQNGRDYGCTYSDLRQRLIPSVVIQALEANQPISGKELIAGARAFEPTRPFDSEE